MVNKEGFTPKYGDYRNLLTYPKAKVIYDRTVYFCNRFFQK